MNESTIKLIVILGFICAIPVAAAQAIVGGFNRLISAMYARTYARLTARLREWWPKNVAPFDGDFD